MRFFLLTLGFLSLALGILGIFLPLLPTTPFLLLTAWCFARSSPRFHHWLHHHPQLGPTLAAWETKKAIPTAAKRTAMIMILVSLTTTWIWVDPLAIRLGVSAMLAGVSLFILTRPAD